MTAQTSTLTTPGLASTIVQESLGAAQYSLSGELQVVNPAVLAQLFVSPSLPIDARVSEKLRLKVWNNEYFDFGALLSNPVFDSKYQVTVSSSDKGQMPSLCLEPVARAKKNLSIESCFHIFVGVYTSKFPHEAPALMKYGRWCKTWQPGASIRNFMTKTSVSLDKRSLIHSHGAVFIGSCGCVHSIPLLKNHSNHPLWHVQN